MLYYYPKVLPLRINKNRLVNSKDTRVSSYTQTTLYSQEGIYHIKKGKLYTVHFNDSLNSVKNIINNDEYISDTSDIVLSPSQKLPYEFIKQDIMVTVYEKGSVKMVIEEAKDKLMHIYFEVKNNDIYGVHEDINELMKYAKS
jgi:hypothetical protein